MEEVLWKDAVEFCERLSRQTGKAYRLPSEAEWEYACRAGSTSKYHFGDDVLLLGQYAWSHSNSGFGTGPVGQKMPNAWGLYDMHGNVWQWCQDVWHDNYEGAPSDGHAWLENGHSEERMLRGGAWWDVGSACRVAFRRISVADNFFKSVGLRVVSSIRPT